MVVCTSPFLVYSLPNVTRLQSRENGGGRKCSVHHHGAKGSQSEEDDQTQGEQRPERGGHDHRGRQHSEQPSRHRRVCAG